VQHLDVVSKLLCDRVLEPERNKSWDNPKSKLGEIVKTVQPLILMLIFQTCCVDWTQAQSSNVIGSWKVEITFGNGDGRSFRFEARESGKGSFLPVPSSILQNVPRAGLPR